MTGDAYTQLKLQTKASLDKTLIFVHCMERKYMQNSEDKYTFTDETCNKSRQSYMRNVLGYKKVKDLYEDSLNAISSNYIPDVSNLKICIVVYSNRNMNANVNMNVTNDNDNNNMEMDHTSPDLVAPLQAMNSQQLVLPSQAMNSQQLVLPSLDVHYGNIQSNDQYRSTMNRQPSYDLNINVNARLNVNYGNIHSNNHHMNRYHPYMT